MPHIGIDIFSGAGGLSLGAELAGVDVRYAIEIDPSAANTYRRNHTEAKVLCDDICKLDPKSLKDKDNPVFIIMGGPPCQGFSMANTMSRNMDNPKNFLFKEFVRFVKEIQPQWFVLENVSGMMRMNHGETINMIENCFRELGLGYEIKSKVLWADQFGVPQRRNRLFMVGNRVGANFEFPEAKTDTIVTVEEAFVDLPILENGQMLNEASYTKSAEDTNDYVRFIRNGSDKARQNFVSKNNDLVIERYKYIGQGQNWRAIPEELMQNYSDKQRCHSGIYKRLKADEPSVVISNYRKSMLIHPYEHRGISVREAARLQSFPDTFIFEGPISHIQQQIGNAVPPLLAKAVIEKILSYNE